MTQELEKKVQRAIKLIQSASKIATEHGQPLEVEYSGGKDSDVILELTKMANVPYRAIYKNTTIDPPGTIKHVKDMGVEVMPPKYNFFKLVEKMGFPSRFMRFCCGYLKEYKILDYVIMGIRKDESVKRDKRYMEPEDCRVYNKKEKVRAYYPILDWTYNDVEVFIKERNIKCAPLYYDSNGLFHVERRLGCMCCPLQYKAKRIEAFKKYPNMVKAYIRAGKKYLETHNNKTTKRYHDVYEWFVYYLFYSDNPKEWVAINESTFLPPPNYKEFLENYFNIKFND